MTTEQIRKKMQEQIDRRSSVHGEWRKKLDEARKPIDELYKPVFDEIDKLENELRAELDKALVREALKANSGKYPVGTRMVEWEWKFERTGTDKFRRVPRKTERIGIVEVFARGCPHVGMAYAQPKPGEYIIRILKKNGAASLFAASLGNLTVNSWLPEGEKPKTKQ